MKVKQDDALTWQKINGLIEVKDSTTLAINTSSDYIGHHTVKVQASVETTGYVTGLKDETVSF